MTITTTNAACKQATDKRRNVQGLQFGYQALQSNRYTRRLWLVDKSAPKMSWLSLAFYWLLFSCGTISITRIDLTRQKSTRAAKKMRRKNANDKTGAITCDGSTCLRSVALLHVTCNLYICTPPIYLVQFRRIIAFLFRLGSNIFYSMSARKCCHLENMKRIIFT